MITITPGAVFLFRFYSHEFDIAQCG